MPHVRINYSSNLPGFDAGLAIDHVIDALVDTGEFEEQTIKARAYRADVFEVGKVRSGRGFVDVVVKILPGRSAEVRAAVAQRLCEVIGKNGHFPKDVEVQITAEVTELSDSYTKLVVPIKDQS